MGPGVTVHARNSYMYSFVHKCRLRFNGIMSVQSIASYKSVYLAISPRIIHKTCSHETILRAVTSTHLALRETVHEHAARSRKYGCFFGRQYFVYIKLIFALKQFL